MRFDMIPMALIGALWIQGAALAQEANQAQEAPNETSVAETQPAADTPAAEPPTADQSSTAAPDDSLLSEGQLEQLVAPIALYPDPLLADVLIASTYPLEVVQADRWYEKNKELKGDALQEALKEQDWDDSIKGLVAVPDALNMMNEDLDWTENLGNAVLAQQADVMDAVQSLRARAKENGKLESNPQQTVTVTQTVVQDPPASAEGGQAAPQGGQATRDVIVIEPTNPETVYVPYYEPSVVYGTWPYPRYAPYYFPPPVGYGFGSALATGLVWSAGFAIGNAVWGNGFNWGRNDINVNVNRNISGNTINRNNINAQKWEHNSAHRRGVQYNNTNVKNKFSGGNQANLGDKRPGDRRPGGGDGPPGGGNLGDKRPGGGDGRPGGGNKRPTVGDIEAGLKRPGGGERPSAGGGKRPNAGAGNRPNAGGGNRPNKGDIQAGLKNKPAANRPSGNKPAAKKPANRPAAKKPANRQAANKPANRPAPKKPAAKKPAPKKPAARKPQSKPSGNAFQKRDASRTRSAASRGRASAGNRNVSRGRSGGGHRAGGGGRGGGRRR